jgi:hypothetical protein
MRAWVAITACLLRTLPPARSTLFKRVSCGTELHVTQEGVPAAIPPEMCYLGWQESLNLLALLVEAEIPAA